MPGAHYRGAPRLTRGSPGAPEGRGRLREVELRARIPASTVVEIGRGSRALVVSDLLLPEQLTDASASASATLAPWSSRPGRVRASSWSRATSSTPRRPPTWRVSSRRRSTRTTGSATRSRRSARSQGAARIVLPGWRDAELAEVPSRQRLGAIGLEVAHSVELVLETASGPRRVVVETARPTFVGEHTPSSEWLVGEEYLEDPAAAPRFLASRLRYRALRKLLWVAPLIAVLAIVATRVGIVVTGAQPHPSRTTPSSAPRG